MNKKLRNARIELFRLKREILEYHEENEFVSNFDTPWYYNITMKYYILLKEINEGRYND